MFIRQRLWHLAFACTSAIPIAAQLPVPLSNYGNNGVALIQNVGSTPDLFILDIVEDADGHVYAVGHYDNGSFRHLMVHALNSNGQTLTGFGVNGRFISPGSWGTMAGRAIAIRPDGRILVAGTQGFSTVVIQLLPDGTLDEDFGTNGITFLDADVSFTVQDLVIAPEGSFYLCGRVGYQSYLLRMQPDGELDPLFGNDGLVLLSGPESSTSASDILLSPTGYIVVTGTEYAPTPGYGFLAAVDLSGAPIPWFGDNGMVIINNWPTSLESMYHGTWDLEGRILLAGEWIRNGVRSNFLLRFMPNGEVDLSFAELGILNIPRLPGTYTSYPAPHVLPNGTILVCGGQTGTTVAHANVYITKLSNEGVLDNDFGEYGTYHYLRPGYLFSYAYGTMLNADGVVKICASVHQGGTLKNSVVAFTTNDLVTALDAASPNTLHLYPNPTTGRVTVDGLMIEGARSLQLFDDRGSLITEWPIGTTRTGGPLVLELPASLANGYYTLAGTTNSGRRTTQVALIR